MKILYLAHRVPYPPNKGDKIRALWEIKSLSSQHEIDLFCFYDHEEDRNSIDALRQYCNDCYVERLSWVGSRLRALKAVATKKPFSLAYFCSATMARKIKEAIAARGYDLVIVFSSAMAPYVEQESIPCLLDMVDVDSAKWTEYATTAPALLRWLWRQEGDLLAAYENHLAKTFAQTLLCTDAETAMLQKSVPDARIDVLRHMVDTEYFNPEKVEVPAEIAALQPYVVFAGSMDYAPNVEASIWFYRNALPALQKRIPQLKFVIVGRNPAKAVIELGKDPAVHVTGTVPDVRPYFRGAAATVAPMQLARGVQNKILESMAMGVPAASSSKAAVAFPPEVARLILVEDDPQLLAEKLTDVIESQPQPPRMEIRQALESVFGDSSLKARLEAFVSKAVKHAGTNQLKQKTNKSPESAARVEVSAGLTTR
ncbi:MAG TPA: TIGR03087 family PEP-CTERM/XrtA system glycosyltransferase [Candidatus Angelobacter sp.]|jgi:sugar transferase (PEP-CTERM/EpsH1 system associated)